MANARLWVGTRDDYVAGDDRNIKVKGNLTGSGFEAITSQNSQAKAILIKNDSSTTSGTSILFYSTSTGADTTTDSCCNFSNVTNKDPRNSVITTPDQDGSYALFIRLADLAIGASDGMTWYYAAAPTSQINSVVTSVAQSAGVATPTTTPTTTPQDTAVSTAQNTPVQPVMNTTTGSTALTPTAPPPSVVLTQQGSLPVFDVNGGLAFVQVGAPQGQGSGSITTTIQSVADLPPDLGGRDPLGFMRVFVISGGLNLPAVALNALGQNRQNDANQ